MDPLNLVPDSKDDIQKAISLETAPEEDILSNIDAIFESLEDVNWPISQVFIRALAPKFDLIRGVLHEYLRESHPGVKYTLLNMFFVSSDATKQKWLCLKEVLLRIAERPSNAERVTGSYEYAKRILDYLGIDYLDQDLDGDCFLPISEKDFNKHLHGFLKLLDFPDQHLERASAEFLVKYIDMWSNDLHTILRGESTNNVNVLSILRNVFYKCGNSELLAEFDEDLNNLPSEQAKETVRLIREKYKDSHNV